MNRRREKKKKALKRQKKLDKMPRWKLLLRFFKDTNCYISCLTAIAINHDKDLYLKWRENPTRLQTTMALLKRGRQLVIENPNFSFLFKNGYFMGTDDKSKKIFDDIVNTFNQYMR